MKLWCRSILGTREKRGLVCLELGEKQIAQLSIDEARELHRNLGACIEAAQTDEFLFTFMRNRLNVGEEAAVSVLADFREMRKKMGTSE